MKKIISLLFALVALTTSISLSAKESINSSVIHTADERDVKNFKGIAAGGPINVVITLGSTESCRFEGDSEAIATLITEVKGNVLIIRPENSWKSWAKKYENKQITAYVTAKTITSLTMSGNGNMTVNGTINSQSLATTLSGSGSIKATINVDELTSVMSGSGKLNINGKADDATITMSGSGNFAGKSFTVNNLSTQLSGSGTINIKAESKIDALISGSGNVNYTGNASVEKTVIGSGRVNKI